MIIRSFFLLLSFALLTACGGSDDNSEQPALLTEFEPSKVLNEQWSLRTHGAIEQQFLFVEPLLLKDKIITASIIDSEKSRIFDNPNESKRLTELLEWVKSKDEDMEYFLVLIKPNCITIGINVVALIKGAGYDVGFDPLEEDRTVLSP